MKLWYFACWIQMQEERWIGFFERGFFLEALVLTSQMSRSRFARRLRRAVSRSLGRGGAQATPPRRDWSSPAYLPLIRLTSTNPVVHPNTSPPPHLKRAKWQKNKCSLFARDKKDAQKNWNFVKNTNKWPLVNGKVFAFRQVALSQLLIWILISFHVPKTQGWISIVVFVWCRQKVT